MTDAPISLADLCDNPERHGFTRAFRCDRCQAVTYCAPDFEPPACPQCNPEQWKELPE